MNTTLCLPVPDSTWIFDAGPSSSEATRDLRFSRRPHNTTDAESIPEIDGYEILRLLGRGGQARVYLALRDGKRFALKVTTVGTPEEREHLESLLLKEFRVARALQGPYIVDVDRFVMTTDRTFYSMRFMEHSLRDEMNRRGIKPFRLWDTLRILKAISHALRHVHRHGFVHKDIKPSNILTDRNGEIVLSDFGLCENPTRNDIDPSPVIVGTPTYMSPEQMHVFGPWVCMPASDIYSVGVILYNLLTGIYPYRTTRFRELWKAMRSEDIVPPHLKNRAVPQALSDLCMRCLVQDPMERIQCGRELLQQVRQVSAMLN